MRKSKPSKALQMRLPQLPTTQSRLDLAALIKGLYEDQDIESASFRKVMAMTCDTALGIALSAQEPMIPCGRRIPFVRASDKHKDLMKVAKRLNPGTKYSDERAYPDIEELQQLCRHRFGKLNNSARGQRAYGDDFDPLVADALAICYHPAPDQVAEAHRVLHHNRHSLGRNSKALEFAWRNDLMALRSSLGDRELVATPEFRDLYPGLVAAKGVTGAVLFVLEQAAEFERTCDYIAGHLDLFQAIKSSDGIKGLRHADCEAVLMFPVAFGLNGIVPGDPNNHAQLAFKLLRKFGPARNRADAPEGERFHSIMGFSPLEYLLIYFFSCHDRFGRFVDQKTSLRYSLNSACFRLAMNCLAHIKFEEAKAEFALRVSQTHIGEGGKDRRPKSERAMIGGFDINAASSDFDLFDAEAGTWLARFDFIDRDWMGEWVRKFRQSYDAMRGRGLYDERLNPMLRAFPFPEAWSEDRDPKWLSHWFAVLTKEINALDPLYTPLNDGCSKAQSTMKVWQLSIALELAAAMIEVPNPFSMARSFAISPKKLRTFQKGRKTTGKSGTSPANAKPCAANIKKIGKCFSQKIVKSLNSRDIPAGILLNLVTKVPGSSAAKAGQPQ